MGALSRKLRSFATSDGAKAGVGHWCPACKEAHVVYTKNPGGPQWEWNGDVDAPTIKPSVRTFNPAKDGEPERTICHYVLTAGVINYCGDCEHELSGKSVPLPDWPDDYGGLE